MPRRETVLSVFVASPSDIDDERNRLEETIQDLNLSWARTLGIRLELVRWETHAYPAFGSSPQAVINEQIPDDYDIFIGLMWYKFGTPTEHASSGTHEEFRRAKSRFDTDPNSVHLMIYFKEAPAPIPPTKLDYTQLAQVAEFRSTLGEDGGLYWTFQTLDEFAQFVRLHLTRFVQSKKAEIDAAEKPETTPRGNHETSRVNTGSHLFIEDASNEDNEEELGFLDLTERVQDEFLALVEITENIASATTEVGEKVRDRTNEMGDLSKSPRSSNVKSVKRIIEKSAADMDQYSHRMEAEMPLFSNHLNTAMNALTKAAEISIDFSVDESRVDEIRENVDSIRKFRQTMGSVVEQLTEFRDSVSSLPRLTAVLNRSKRRMAQVIQRVIDELDSAQRMAEEAETSLNSIVHASDQAL